MPNRWPPLLTLPAVVLLATLFSGAWGQGPAPSPAPMPASMDCTTPLLNLTDCLTYVENGSNLTLPDTGCCPGLIGLVGSSPLCLCQLLSSGEALGFQVDKAKALKLPKACHVDTPPVSLCAVLGIPVASPMSPGLAPTNGGPSESTGGLVTPGSTPSTAPMPRSVNHGSSSFRASDIMLLIGLSWAGMGLAAC